MSFDAQQLAEIGELCPGAKEMTEGATSYIYLPAVDVPRGGTMKALLCPCTYGGYMTKLFLEKPIGGKTTTEHVILGQKWYSFSWQGVAPSLRLAQILAGHLRALT